MTKNSYRIVLVGPEDVGKTTYINRCATGDFTKFYTATVGLSVKHLTFSLSDSTDIKFEIYDCAGQERLAGLCDGYYIGADAVMVMFDVTDKITFERALNGYWWYSPHLKNIPALLLCNKVDSTQRCVPWRKIKPAVENKKHELNRSIIPIEMSSRSCYHLDKPWLELARQLKKNPELTFT
jgi:GTP-binding nuclear protein Ran